jgi:hypothetical protein
LKKGNDEKSSKTQPTPSLRRSSKPNHQGQEEEEYQEDCHQTRHPLFVIVARRKATTLSLLVFRGLLILQEERPS